MWRAVWVVLSFCSLFAGELQQQLDQQLDAGTLTFSSVEAALVAEGVADGAALSSYLKRYQGLLDGIRAEVGDKSKGKKLAKALHKAVLAALKLEGEPGDGIRNLLDDKSQTPILASYVLASLAASAGLSGEDWSEVHEKLESTLSGSTPDEVLAVLLALEAYHRDDDQTAASCQMLRLSANLNGTKAYAWGDLDKLFYNRALKLFNDGELMASAQLALGACTRFPQQALLYPLAFNLGVKLLGDSGRNEGERLALIQRLHPLMGPHAHDFEAALDSYRYNRAAQLYNAGDYEAAVSALEQVARPPDEEQFKRVLANTYAALAESRISAGKTAEAAAFQAKLAALDPERAALNTHRLAQMELKALVDSGNLEQAVAQAAAHLDSAQDRSNYKSVLIQYNEGLRGAGKYEQALAALDAVPAAAELGETAQGLRFNTYSDWLESFDEGDYVGALPVYGRLFADKQVRMTPENAAIMRENHALLLRAEIVKLVEERKFKEADEKSKAALKLVPGNAGLLQQRQLVETIMRRITE